MKTLTFSAFLMLAVISFSSFKLSQPEVTKAVAFKTQGFHYFRIHRQAKDVVLSWSASASAAQFRIERSYDGEFFDEIATVESNGTSGHKFKDQNVFPGYSYYRIVSLNANGQEEETSNVEVIRIVQRK